MHYSFGQWNPFDSIRGVWFVKYFSMELEFVKELEFVTNSLALVFCYGIRNWNLNVIPPTTTTYGCFSVGLFGFRIVWVGLIGFEVLKLYSVTELNMVWVSGRTKPKFVSTHHLNWII